MVNQNVCTINISVLKERLFDQYKQTWYNDIINSSKLHYYSHFKQSFGPQCEKHLSVVHNRNYRRALSQFRMSTHNLQIEKGRYLGLPQAERLCKLCNMNDIENEYHFLLACPTCRNLRKLYLPKFYWSFANVFKFKSLMPSSSLKTINSIAKYVYYSTKLRNHLLEL